MTRQYEVVYIFDSTLEEAQVNEHLARFHALLKTPSQPDPVTRVNHWGKRSLAYPIKRRETGYYVAAQFQAEPGRLAEFERAIKLDESVLRHLVVIDEGATPATVRVTEDEEATEDLREELDE